MGKGENDELGWLQKLPFVSLLLVVAFAAVPFRLANDGFVNC